MSHVPTWKNATDEQKFEFLYDWCDNLSRSLQAVQAGAHGLHERLSLVEAKVAEIPSAPKP